MAIGRSFYLICYDIRDQKRWRKCHKLLKSYGAPLQYSIFQCHLSKTTMSKLRWELSVIFAEEDSLLIAPIHDADVNRIVQWNVKNIIEKKEDRFKLF
ncbi:CRISPR-associated endonuclease Cas2 [Ferroacidibacillus organovorans]|uniref:CRISPR-associated endoribonuclease Cas2 n=2 Tax=Ferroacidibacillus organovorans TaxID=1765683 RepID=A0A1V4EXS8_9BACL|nr:CRISPR-associated endonuclease Cas2 [Ferroacidibacillus organovorans]OPG17662.1 CRISPR-associated endonuclease Cas2 [Ferroacidibacillus organovorans]